MKQVLVHRVVDVGNRQNDILVEVIKEDNMVRDELKIISRGILSLIILVDYF